MPAIGPLPLTQRTFAARGVGLDVACRGGGRRGCRTERVHDPIESPAIGLTGHRGYPFARNHTGRRHLARGRGTVLAHARGAGLGSSAP